MFLVMSRSDSKLTCSEASVEDPGHGGDNDAGLREANLSGPVTQGLPPRDRAEWKGLQSPVLLGR